MLPFVVELVNPGIGTELIYSFVIIVCSLMVYFGTKELDELSSYKGISYFRLAFLFFAIAYFFRSFIKLLIGYFNVEGILELGPRAMGHITLFLFVYFSTMAIFYLIYSIKSKKWKEHPKQIYLFQALALLTAVMSTFLRSSLVYLIINFSILLFALILFFTSPKETQNKGDKKNKTSLHAIYALFFTFWSFNVIDILIPDFLQYTKLFIYVVSLGLFLAILYKVVKKIG